MAVCTLALLFDNPAVFTSTMKIRRGLTVKLIFETQSMMAVAKIFRREVESILGRGELSIDVICGKVSIASSLSYEIHNADRLSTV